MRTHSEFTRRAFCWPLRWRCRARLPAAGDIAIVVRPDVPVDNLTFAELRKVLLGDRQFWTSNLRVTLLVRAPGAREREVVLKTIYQMSEAQFRQYWIAKVFRAEAAAGPRIVYSNEMAAELTSAMSRAPWLSWKPARFPRA